MSDATDRNAWTPYAEPTTTPVGAAVQAVLLDLRARFPLHHDTLRALAAVGEDSMANDRLVVVTRVIEDDATVTPVQQRPRAIVNCHFVVPTFTRHTPLPTYDVLQRLLVASRELAADHEAAHGGRFDTAACCFASCVDVGGGVLHLQLVDGSA
jgi:hypothetical protein